MTTLGVLADTHIPDRVPQLDPHVLQVFRHAHVDAILHAGDVSVPDVLRQLEQLAPVHAVRGNRDVFRLHSLPLHLELNFNGISIGMAHGHGTFSRYMVDKLHRALKGRLVQRYLTRLLAAFPQADVIVFGHLHVPCNLHLQGKLLFNPGSTSYPWPRSEPPTYGLLHIAEGKAPWGELITLARAG